MPDSSLTKKLVSIALSSGDAYYKCAKETLLKGVVYDEECQQLGKDYLERLHTLREHLSSLKRGEKVLKLRNFTDIYIDLIQKDLELQMSSRKQNDGH